MDNYNDTLSTLVDLYNDYAVELAEELNPYREKLEHVVDTEYNGDLYRFIEQNLQNSDYYYLTDFVKKLYYADDVLAI